MKKYISPCTLFFGLLTLAASIFVGYYVVPYKIWENVMQQSKIVQGNSRFKSWETVPVPLFQRIYFFNVTNPHEVIQGGKPILQEVGPYVYQQKRKKFDIVFNGQNDTIFYKERTNSFFRADLSSGLETDKLTIVNLPYVGTVHKAVQMNPMTRYVISEALSEFNEQLYVNVTVGEFLFKGYYVPFIEELSEIRGEEIFPNNTFGIYYGKNGTDAGRFEVYSGDKLPEKFGDVATWNGMPQLDWWNDQYCNLINGSNGAVFRPFTTKDRVLNMFIPGLCRSFRFTFEADEMIQGIPVLKFSLPPSFFESAKTNPDNRCYCVNPGKNFENCPESGVFQLSGCGKGAMMLSQPHFYQGSQMYVNQSVGLNPDMERHEMAMYIESYTSASARIKLRFQMNVDLKPAKHFKPMKKIPKMVHPLFWIDQTVEIPEHAAVLLRDKLYKTVNVANLLTHVGIIVGGVFIFLSLFCFFFCLPDNTHDGEEDKNEIECVSYNHHIESLSNGSVTFNGTKNYQADKSSHNNVKNRVQKVDAETELEFRPLIKQTGILLSDSNNELSVQQEEISLDPNLQARNEHKNNQAGNYPNKSNSTNFSEQQQQQQQSPKRLQYHQPDSRLSAFPSTVDYSSSLSIPAADNNTLKELVEANSSYENL